MFSFLPTRRKPGWLSVLIEDAALSLAHVVRPPRGGRPEVRWLENFALEAGKAGEDAAAAALLRLRRARRLNAYACTTLLGVGQYDLTQLETPPVPREEQASALRWELKERVNYPPETACLGVLEIPAEGLPASRSPGVLVVSASEQAVRSRLAAFDAARVPLEAIDVPELAQRNVAALLEDENRGLAFLRLDEHGLMLTLTFHGELVAVRRGEISAVHLSGGEERRERARERLVLELQRSLDNFDRQYSHIPVSRVVLSAYPPVEGLSAELAGNIDTPLVDLDLSAVLDCSATPNLKNPVLQARHLLALGAALRTGGAP